GDTGEVSYIAGVYYPDKTRVGWWKNGYPEYFAKVLNAPNWIGINIKINGEELDLATCKKVSNFRRELNMKEGVYTRSFLAVTSNNVEIEVVVKRFLSLEIDEVGAISYQIKVLNTKASLVFEPYLDSGITNEDSNWDDKFWNTTNVSIEENRAFIEAHTMKTEFKTCTFMQASLDYEGATVVGVASEKTDNFVSLKFEQEVESNTTVTLTKFGGYTVTRNHPKDALKQVAYNKLSEVSEIGFEGLLQKQKEAWAAIWEMSDIVIEGDIKAQQGIRFNIFQLNQTYLGTDS
ncbi:unnamed protein product, partial [Ectocarpus sp. 12 AP-2014]